MVVMFLCPGKTGEGEYSDGSLPGDSVVAIIKSTEVMIGKE
jgi:hypothetical protein